MHENRQRLMSEMDRLFSEFDRFFEGINPNGRILSPRHHIWVPPTDVYETGEVMVVKIEVAGMSEQDFEDLAAYISSMEESTSTTKEGGH